ncbi:MAG: hypothetical protein V2B15_08780 [Bacteroidota bacterium]
MDTITEQPTLSVTGLTYLDTNGKLKSFNSEHSSLEELYGTLLEDFEFCQGREPVSIQLSNGEELPFQGTLFHYAFAKGRIPEDQLIDMLRLSKRNAKG